MARLNDDSQGQDRGNPVVTVIVVIVVALAAAMTFRYLHHVDTSPQAQGSSDPLAIASHEGKQAR